MPTLVTGTIQLPDGTDHFSGATIYISLEATSMLNMPSTILAETVQHNVIYEGTALNFSVEGNKPDVEGKVSVRVHISMNHSEDVQKGDFLTKRAHTVSLERIPAQIDVTVDRV